MLRRSYAPCEPGPWLRAGLFRPNDEAGMRQGSQSYVQSSGRGATLCATASLRVLQGSRAGISTSWRDMQEPCFMYAYSTFAIGLSITPWYSRPGHVGDQPDLPCADNARRITPCAMERFHPHDPPAIRTSILASSPLTSMPPCWSLHHFICGEASEGCAGGREERSTSCGPSDIECVAWRPSASR